MQVIVTADQVPICCTCVVSTDTPVALCTWIQSAQVLKCTLSAEQHSSLHALCLDGLLAF
jgi:hypothetical protein